MGNFLKRNFYQIMGYLGVLPFFGFLFGLYYFQNEFITANIMIVMQMIYGAIIISFISGNHWVDAVRNKSIFRITLSLLPTIFLIPIIFWGLSHSPAQAILGMIALFWYLFALDRGFFYYRSEGISMPRGYILYRFNLTLLVTIILFATYWISS